MLKYNSVIHHIARTKGKTNLYITEEETLDLLDNLTPNEHKFYAFCKFSPLKNHTPEDFTSAGLAEHLGMSVKSVDTVKGSLRKKGYVVIRKFKDERGLTLVRVIVGKEMVLLYNCGLNVAITDSKAWPTMIRKFPQILEANVDPAARKAWIDEMNQYYKDNLE